MTILAISFALPVLRCGGDQTPIEYIYGPAPEERVDAGATTDAGIPFPGVRDGGAARRDAGPVANPDAGTRPDAGIPLPDAGLPPPPGLDCRQAPCPSGWYCDLATGECKAGCANDDQCARGEICELDTHRCRVGCRDNSACDLNTRCDIPTLACVRSCWDGYLRCGNDCCTATAISAGAEYTCAVTSQGGVKCWGLNSSGQLGNGTDTDAYRPVDVVGLTSGVRKVATTSAASCYSLGLWTPCGHSCAITTSGGVKCWGSNAMGELGDGTSTDSRVPRDVVGLASGAQEVAVGSQYSCVATVAGEVRCWGNIGGDAGPTPTVVPGLSGTFTRIGGQNGPSSGDFYALTSGKIWTWSWGWFAESPQWLTSHGDNVVDLTIAGEHACEVLDGGAARCWGRNWYGQLGNGSTTDTSAPVVVRGLGSGVRRVSTGGSTSCALTNTGGVLCWGSNDRGQLGTGIAQHKSSVPVTVSLLDSGVREISVGSGHACAIADGGLVACWGSNSNGEAGRAPSYSIDRPKFIENP